VIEDDEQVMSEVSAILESVLGDAMPDHCLTRETALQADLAMESIHLFAVAGRLQTAYGELISMDSLLDLIGENSVAELRLGQIVDLIVAASP
jgi:acyl carrier protein